MGYPKLTVDREKLKHNVIALLDLCGKAGIEVSAVTKVFCAHPEIVRVFVDAGVKTLADSRIQNLIKMAGFPVQKMMLRLPMISEAEEVVTFSDVSLNSELMTVKALSKAAVKTGRRHGVILMVELGDMREGIMPADVSHIAGEALKLKGIDLAGLGANLNCYGGVLPTEKNLSELVDLARQIEIKFGIRLPVISGGNSGSVYLVENGAMPEGINQLRLGEVILRGIETSYQKKVDGLYTDVFTFHAEMVEIKEKPSVPYGELGQDAFGNRREYEDKGTVRRAILACGRQDIAIDYLTPFDSGVGFIGASSDHLITDITHAEKDYSVGDAVSFSLAYGGILAACTSEYVHKEIL